MSITSILPITIMVILFLLFLSLYWVNLHGEYVLLEKNDLGISILNSYYFFGYNNDKVHRCSPGFVSFPIYDGSLCTVSTNE